MLGWRVIVTQLAPEEYEAATDIDRRTKMLASWEVGLGGTDWLDELIKEGKASLLSDNGGYPCRYTAKACDVLPLLMAGPPPHAGPPVFGDDYVLPGNWSGRVTIHHDRLAACPLDQVLTIDAWDLS